MDINADLVEAAPAPYASLSRHRKRLADAVFSRFKRVEKSGISTHVAALKIASGAFLGPLAAGSGDGFYFPLPCHPSQALITYAAVFLPLPRFVPAAGFWARIRSSSTEAGSSFGSWGTSSPRNALANEDVS